MTSIIEKKQESHSRQSWIDNLKGIGIILVLIGHIYSNETVFNWLYSFHMPLFFFAAGYTYKEKPIPQDIKRRFQTIVIPYFLFGLLVLFYWAVLERRFRESNVGILESFLGLLRGQYQYLDFNVHLWFLPCFFMTVVLFNVLVNICRQVRRRVERRIEYREKQVENRDKQIEYKPVGTRGYCRLAYYVSAVMSLVLIISDISGNPLPELPWGIDRIFKYIGFYAVGHFLRENHVEKVIREKSRAGVAVTAAVLLNVNFLLSYAGLTTGVMWFVTALIGVAAVGIISIVIDRNRVLQYFGRISLIILCVHGSVYRVIIKLVSVPTRMSTGAVRENFILALLVVVLTLLVCAAVHGVVIRTVPWMVGKPKEER